MVGSNARAKMLAGDAYPSWIIHNIPFYVVWLILVSSDAKLVLDVINTKVV